MAQYLPFECYTNFLGIYTYNMYKKSWFSCLWI
jgi:hypothetical protein